MIGASFAFPEQTWKKQMIRTTHRIALHTDGIAMHIIPRGGTTSVQLRSTITKVSSVFVIESFSA